MGDGAGGARARCDRRHAGDSNAVRYYMRACRSDPRRLSQAVALAKANKQSRNLELLTQFNVDDQFDVPGSLGKLAVIEVRAPPLPGRISVLLAGYFWPGLRVSSF